MGNLSSTYHRNAHAVRKDGSYIYETFLRTQGSDVKVYTVGPDYAHAEARKSPTLDGRVQRDPAGKEVRAGCGGEGGGVAWQAGRGLSSPRCAG